MRAYLHSLLTLVLVSEWLALHPSLSIPGEQAPITWNRRVSGWVSLPVWTLWGKEAYTYLLTPWSRVLLEKLTSKLSS